MDTVTPLVTSWIQLRHLLSYATCAGLLPSKLEAKFVCTVPARPRRLSTIKLDCKNSQTFRENDVSQGPNEALKLFGASQYFYRIEGFEGVSSVWYTRQTLRQLHV